MASSGSFILNRTSGTEYLQGRVEWSARQNADDIINNRSVVTAKLIFKRTNLGHSTYGTGTFTMTVNGTQFTTGSVSYDFTSADKVMIEKTVTVQHNGDGSKSFTISATYTGNSPIGGNGAQAVALNNIDRSPPSVSFTASSITASSVTISATAGVKCNIWQRSINGGSSWTQFSTADGTSASTTITGLSPNTSYAIKVRARKTSNHVYGDSSAKTVTTLGNTVLNSVSGITIDAENPVINMNVTVYNASYRNKLTLKRGNTVVLALDNLTWPLGSATRTIALTPAQVETVLLAMTDVKSFSGSFELETYNGSTKIGSTSAKTAAVATSDRSAPTWSNEDGFVTRDSNALTVSVTGNDQLYIQNYSELLATIFPAVPKNGAAIVTYSVTVSDKTVTSETTELNAGTIPSSGDVTVIVTATDSRGYIVSKTKFLKVIPYDIVELQLEDDDNIRRVNNVETYTVFKLAGKLSPVTVDEEDKNNIVTLRCRYKLSGTDTYGDWVNLDFSQTSTSFSFADSHFGEFERESAYDIQVEVSDRITTDTITLSLPSAIPLMALRKKKVGINKLNPEAALDVVGDIWLNGKNLFDLIYPVGSIYLSVNNVDPAALFGGTWTVWGSGRVPVGVNADETEFNTVEKTGGTKTNTHWHYQTIGNDGSVYVTRTGNSPSSRVKSINRTMVTTANSATGLTREDSTYEQTIGTLQPYITCFMWKRTA